MGQEEGSWEWLLGSLLVRNGPILHTNSQDTFPAQVFHNPASPHFSNLISRPYPTGNLCSDHHGPTAVPTPQHPTLYLYVLASSIHPLKTVCEVFSCILDDSRRKPFSPLWDKAIVP